MEWSWATIGQAWPGSTSTENSLLTWNLHRRSCTLKLKQSNLLWSRSPKHIKLSFLWIFMDIQPRKIYLPMEKEKKSVRITILNVYVLLFEVASYRNIWLNILVRLDTTIACFSHINKKRRLRESILEKSTNLLPWLSNNPTVCWTIP